MKRIHCTRLLMSIALTMLATGLAAAQAPAGPHRPAGVPAEFVVTPFGYFHPSCVNHLAKGDVFLHDEAAIQRANGSYETIQECAFPHFEADGTKVVGNPQPVANGDVDPPSIGHHWIVDASTSTTTAYGEISATWNVPAPPKNHDGQTIYLFPGLEQLVGDVTIVQPVLGWNADFANAWGIASWNCCVKGGVNEAAAAPVNTGDVIFGQVFSTCAKGTLTCSKWDILTADGSGSSFSELIGTSNDGQTFNWAFGGVLEVYNISNCGDYPDSGEVSFYDLGLWDYNLKHIASPAWKVTKLSAGLTPQCSYGGSLPKQVDLTF